MFKTTENGKQPTIGTEDSACLDLYASCDVSIRAGESKKVPLGVLIDLEQLKVSFVNEIKNGSVFNFPTDSEIENQWKKFLKSHYLHLEPRSSLRNDGFLSGTGVIDLDFKNEIQIIIHNLISHIQMEDNQLKYYGANREEFRTILRGDKIAQIMLCPHKTYLSNITTDIKRDGGFGSTGK